MTVIGIVASVACGFIIGAIALGLLYAFLDGMWRAWTMWRQGYRPPPRRDWLE
jgi:hypothetical protein